MTRRVAVLGAGRVGSTIARDLALDPGLRVTLADRDRSALARVARGIEEAGGRVEPVEFDSAAARAVGDVAARHDVLVGAVPGYLGDRVLEAAVTAGTAIVDIAFGPEDPLRHDALARERGAVAVVDCGVAPGLSNLLVGRAIAELDEARSASILVGGLPVRRSWPFEYVSVFSPTDVVEEYTRPSRIRVAGREVERPALSDVETVEIPGVGTLEAFLTDGLRTLLHTTEVPDLVEKTLRYPGHADRMRMLRDAGFFDERPLDVDGSAIAPRRLTEALLFRAWEPRPDDEEFTVLRVEVAGVSRGAERRIVYDVLDRTDPRDGTTSMARTTGFPCAIVARLVADGTISAPGVHPPERIALDDAVFDAILAGLAERGVSVHREDVAGSAR